MPNYFTNNDIASVLLGDHHLNDLETQSLPLYIDKALCWEHHIDNHVKRLLYEFSY